MADEPAQQELLETPEEPQPTPETEPEAETAAPAPEPEPEPQIDYAAEAQREREERIRLEERLRAQERQPEKPKRYTRAELQAAVENGTIDEARRDAILDEQFRQDYVSREELDARDVENRRIGRLQSEVDAHLSARPAIGQKGTAERRRVQEEFDYLVRIDGQPKTEADRIAYEAKACRAAFGDPRRRVPERTAQAAETHREGGSGAGVGGGASRREPKIMQGLSREQREFYEHGISIGLYKGLDDKNLRKEIEQYAKRAH